MHSIRLALAALLLLPAAARAIDITSCDSTVPAGEVGVLQADVSCAGAFVGVRLDNGAQLQLNGHSLSGTLGGASNEAALVQCGGKRCAVTGPGELFGSNGAAIGLANGRLVVSGGVSIHDCRRGIRGTPSDSFNSKVLLTDVTIDGIAEEGVWADVIKATGVSVTDARLGIAGHSLKATSVSLANNATSGWLGDKVAARGLVANGNGDCGVRSIRAKLVDSDVTGNDGLNVGGDVCTVRRPRVVNTTCGKSVALGQAVSDWDVCSGD